MKKFSLGVLGCSNIANKSVIPAIIASDYFELTSVGSRSDEKAKDFASRFGCRASDYSGVIGDDSLDAVYISLPPSMHYEWGVKVLSAGKHLIMEKPFCDTLDRAEHLYQLAAVQELTCMEALVYIYHPLFTKVESLLREGAVGEVRLIEAHFGFPFLAEGNFRNNPELGGGALLDNAIYPISLVLHLLGSDYRKFSFQTHHSENHPIDDRGYVSLEYENSRANICYGFGFMYRNDYTIWGETGTIKADRVFSRPPDFVNNIEVFRQEGKQEFKIDPADQFKLMFDDFGRKIADDAPLPLNLPSDTLERMKIISSIYEDHYSRFSTKT